MSQTLMKRFSASHAGSRALDGNPKGQGRSLLWADMTPVKSAKKIAVPFTFANTNLDPFDAERRRKQIDFIFNTLIPEANFLEDWIFTGDYNERSDGYFGNKLRENGLNGSFHGIDWVLATEDIRVMQPAIYSFSLYGHPPTDHSPCIAYLEFSRK